ncbi:MAG: hypothetical protein LQ338_008050, partial [Usnochroma carphineum]
DAPRMTPIATDPNRPACPRLPIIPAIPRKLERKLRNNSSLAAESRSAPSNVPEPPASRPILRTDETLQEGFPDGSPQDHDKSTSSQEAQPVETTTDGLPKEADAEGGTAATHSMEAIDTEESVAAANPSVPSVLDPQTPPFVPEASKTPPEALHTTSNSNSEGEISLKQSNPQVPYPLQTATPWMSYETTPPDDSLHSPAQQPHYSHGHSPTLFYDQTAPYNHPSVNPAVYYGYGHSHNLSFYPQSSQSYASASPAQSSYEGYAIANTPHVIHSRPNAPSHGDAPITATQYPNSPLHPSYQPQPQYPPTIPQFGSHLPITPSATPSNSGSHKKAPPSTDDNSQDTSTKRLNVVHSHDQGKISKEVSQDYRDWCGRTIGTLKEDLEPSARPSALLSHIINNFNNPAFADCELYVSHVSNRFEPAVISLHSLLIAQNSVLHKLVQRAEIREDGKKQILLAVKDQYTNPAALETAIKVCYGERPSQYVGYPGDLGSEREVSTAWMHNALALAAAGHLLEMTGVAHRGEQIASVILDWHNLEQALSFAMDPNIQRAWGSSTASFGFPCNASELLLSCLYFVISNVSEDISLDLTAKPLPSIDRLPAVPDTQAQSTRSRLSQIQFGDLRVETPEAISEHDVLVSKVLLSLPFVHFKFIIDRIPLNVNRKITKTLVEERERRRIRALGSRTATNEASPDDSLAPVQAEQLVEESDERKGRLSVEEVKV